MGFIIEIKSTVNTANNANPKRKLFDSLARLY